MPKSADAFRTISEVADWLEIQAHVLRFWESKFTQVKPIKRAGGRRYYRPADMLLLGGIKRLLHDDGLTIKGVQKILREEGMNHVASLSAPLDELGPVDMGDGHDTIDMPDPAPQPSVPQSAENVVLPFAAPREGAADAADLEPGTETPSEDQSAAADLPAPDLPAPPAIASSDAGADTEKDAAEPMAPVTVDQDTATPVPPAEDTRAEPSDAVDDDPTPEPAAVTADDTTTTDDDAGEAPAPQETALDAQPAAAQELPTFLRHPLEAAPPPEAAEPEADAPETEQAQPDPEPEKAPPPAQKPRIVDLPPLTAEEDIKAAPGVLSAVLRGVTLTPDQARAAAPLVARLAVLRDQMASPRRAAAKD